MSDEKPKRAFKGIWIPKEIWLDEDLSIQEKVFLVEIDSLESDDGAGCYASNGYFAKFFGLSKKRVSFVINSLSEKGLITSKIDPKSINKNRRRLYIKNKQQLFPKTRIPPPRKRGYPLPENGDTPSPKTGIQDNILDNKTERIADKEDFSQTDLSSNESRQQYAMTLLLSRGVNERVAKSIVFEKHTPLSSIEEAIKNGLAKEDHAKKTGNKFRLGPGYIVKALNQARSEGKVVGATKLSKKLSANLKIPKTKYPPLSQKEFEQRKKQQLQQLVRPG